MNAHAMIWYLDKSKDPLPLYEKLPMHVEPPKIYPCSSEHLIYITMQSRSLSTGCRLGVSRGRLAFTNAAFAWL